MALLLMTRERLQLHSGTTMGSGIRMFGTATTQPVFRRKRDRILVTSLLAKASLIGATAFRQSRHPWPAELPAGNGVCVLQLRDIRA